MIVISCRSKSTRDDLCQLTSKWAKLGHRDHSQLPTDFTCRGTHCTSNSSSKQYPIPSMQKKTNLSISRHFETRVLLFRSLDSQWLWPFRSVARAKRYTLSHGRAIFWVLSPGLSPGNESLYSFDSESAPAVGFGERDGRAHSRGWSD